MEAIKATIESGRRLVIGVDPGPEYSAFVLVYLVDGHTPRLMDAAYLNNINVMGTGLSIAFLSLHDPFVQNTDVFLSYEVVACQGMKVGKSVYETCAMGGAIRRMFWPYMTAVYGPTTSDWRHAVVGWGNAKDSETKAAIEEIFGGGVGTAKNPGPMSKLKEASDRYRAKSGNKDNALTDLRDACGAALGPTMCRMRSRKDPEVFRRHF